MFFFFIIFCYIFTIGKKEKKNKENEERKSKKMLAIYIITNLLIYVISHRNESYNKNSFNKLLRVLSFNIFYITPIYQLVYKEWSSKEYINI